MSVYKDFIFMSGGADANNHLLADFLRFEVNPSRWYQLETTTDSITHKFLSGLAKKSPEVA